MHLALCENTLSQGMLSCRDFEGSSYIEANIAQLVSKREEALDGAEYALLGIGALRLSEKLCRSLRVISTRGFCKAVSRRCTSAVYARWVCALRPCSQRAII